MNTCSLHMRTKCSIDVAVVWCVVADASVCTSTQVCKNLTCSDRVETPFYSCGNFDPVCVHCATSKDLVSGEEARDILPACSSCYKTCLKAFKRKRRLFSPPDSSAKASKIDFLCICSCTVTSVMTSNELKIIINIAHPHVLLQ